MQIKINLQQNYINITLAFLIFINLKKTKKKQKKTKKPRWVGFFLKKPGFFPALKEVDEDS